MKNRNLLRGSLILFTACSLMLASCRKDEPEPEPKPDTEQGTANDNNTAELFAADIESMGAQASEGSDLTTYRSSAGSLLVSPCATVTLNSSAKVFTVDFGTGCLGLDGRTRSGKLVYDFSSSTNNAVFYRNPGFRMTVSSQNYVVDGHQVNILSKTIANTTPTSIPTGTNPGTNLTWSVSANITVTKPNSGGTISWTCSRTKELTNTSDSTCYRGQSQHIVWMKAIVKLNGSASGTNAKGESYSSVATNLIRDFNCVPDPMRPHRHPFVSGTISYTPGSRPTRLIDFGSASSCDLAATVTINNVVYNITLP